MRTIPVLGAVALVIVSVGVAGPAAAAPAWEMPDVEGEILQSAFDSVASATDGAVLPETTPAEGPPFPQYNLANWEVCAQSPEAGDEISVQSPPEFEVARPGFCE